MTSERECRRLNFPPVFHVVLTPICSSGFGCVGNDCESWDIAYPGFAANGNTLFPGTIENSIQSSTTNSWVASSVPSDNYSPSRIPTHQGWAMRVPARIFHHWTRTRCGFFWSADFACEGVDVQISRLGILQCGEIGAMFGRDSKL
jgi:hypothetical protein